MVAIPEFALNRGSRQGDREYIFPLLNSNRGRILRSSLGVFLGCLVFSFGNSLPAENGIVSKTIAVLDLVELGDNQPNFEPSEGLRRSLTSEHIFQIVPVDAMRKKLSEYGVAPSQPCNNSQCSYDAGGYLQVDFVLYGTYSALGKNSHAVTLKLLYVPEGLMAWTWAGELPAGAEATAAWNGITRNLAESAREGRLALRPPKKHRSIAMLDMGESFYLSRVFSERVWAHVLGLTRYEAIGPSEQSELLSALGINKYSISPSPQNMIGVGQRLGASGLLYSRIYRDGDSYLCRLAMYDIERKVVVLEFPPRPMDDFSKVLEYENDFFSVLSALSEKEKVKEEVKAPPPVVKAGRSSQRTLWISLGLLGSLGILFALWVASLK